MSDNDDLQELLDKYAAGKAEKRREESERLKAQADARLALGQPLLTQVKPALDRLADELKAKSQTASVSSTVGAPGAAEPSVTLSFTPVDPATKRTSSTQSVLSFSINEHGQIRYKSDVRVYSGAPADRSLVHNPRLIDPSDVNDVGVRRIALQFIQAVLETDR